MKQKWFVLSTIAAIAMIGMFVFENTSAAHEMTRNKKGHRNVTRGNRIAKMANPMSALNQSWIDLTFGVKADQETLAKALPIYQETRDALQEQIKEASKTADTKREAAKKIRETVKETYTKFKASLKEILTEEQLTKLGELTKKRHAAAQKRLKDSWRQEREFRNRRRHR